MRFPCYKTASLYAHLGVKHTYPGGLLSAHGCHLTDRGHTQAKWSKRGGRISAPCVVWSSHIGRNYARRRNARSGGAPISIPCVVGARIASPDYARRRDGVGCCVSMPQTQNPPGTLSHAWGISHPHIPRKALYRNAFSTKGTRPLPGSAFIVFTSEYSNTA